MWVGREEMWMQEKFGYRKEYTEKYTKFSKKNFKTKNKKI